MARVDFRDYAGVAGEGRWEMAVPAEERDTLPEVKPDPSKCRRVIYKVVILDSAIAFLAPIANHPIAKTFSIDMPLMSGAALIAVLTFTGIWYAERMYLGSASSVAMRDGIAGSFVVAYLVIVGWSAFFPTYRRGQENELAALSREMLTNFTYVTGIVIAFYFGSQAISQVIGSRQSKSREPPPSQAGEVGSPPPAVE